jgi:hypothetical protein
MWKFKQNPSFLHDVEIRTSPNYGLISNAFYTIKLQNFPDLITRASSSTSWGQELVHIRYFEDMDWEDKYWAKLVKGVDMNREEVFLVHDIFGEKIYEVSVFDKLLFDYSTELNKIHSRDASTNHSWKKEMFESLSLLQVKLNKRK